MADLAFILDKLKRAKTNARVIAALTLGGAAAAIAIGIFADVAKLGAASVLLAEQFKREPTSLRVQ